jgi:hypothetical protein
VHRLFFWTNFISTDVKLFYPFSLRVQIALQYTRMGRDSQCWTHLCGTHGHKFIQSYQYGVSFPIYDAL